MFMVMAAGRRCWPQCTVIVSQVRSQLFDREVTTAVDLFGGLQIKCAGQFRFTLTSPTAAEIQDEAESDRSGPVRSHPGGHGRHDVASTRSVRFLAPHFELHTNFR